MKYYNAKTLNENFDISVKRVSDELVKEGFGIVSMVDLKAKFKEKLGIDYNNYLILGVCQPKVAHKALEQEPHIGVFLPCNVIVRELDKDRTEVFAVNPTVTISTIGEDGLNEMAKSIDGKLQNVLERI